MFKKLLLSLIIAVPVVAQAEWIKITESDEREYYLNANNIVDKGATIEYWVKSVIHTDSTKDGQGVGDHSMYRWSAKCNASEQGLLSYANYRGSKVIDSDSRSYASYRGVIPETIGETLFLIACNYIELYRNE